MRCLCVRRLLTAGWSLMLAGAFVSSAKADPPDYLRDVKPILSRRCFACHGPLQQQGKLRMDTGRAMREGGESGPAVSPGSPSDSLLIGAVTGSIGFRMPPEGEGAPLTDAERTVLESWIQAGASYPEDERPAEDPRQFWSYQPVILPAVPLHHPSPWVRTPTDAFIAAEYEAHGLTPNTEANRALLLRRLYLDLVGVPPTVDELHAWLVDSRDDAFERVVDRLLASPLYGQRWGRHWMDVWRYSDWYGSRAINEIRYSQRHIWRWRDWIVESLNGDRGYDRMISEMLAGDELDPGNPDVVRATGFLGRNWYKFDRDVWMFETVEQTCQAFLGLTMRCARCHDHKFDPVTQQDYFRFRAFFEPHDVRLDPLAANQETEKDATLGAVLKEAVSLVYDKQIDAPTYLYARGDSRNPVKDRVLAPGIPEALGGGELPIHPVSLPVHSFYPALRPELVSAMRAQADSAAEAAQKTLAQAEASQRQAAQRLADLQNAGTTSVSAYSGTVFHDSFDAPRPDRWRVAGGKWEYGSGVVAQKEVATFPTLVANLPHPRDFVARLRYRTTEIGSTHSVGLFFDVVELRDCQAVYTATNNTKASVQAFHRQAGVEHYPAAGIFPASIHLNEEVTLDLAVRGALVNVWVNGELAIVYTMPMARQAGTFAIWTHDGGAEFEELSIDPLPEDVVLSRTMGDKCRSPYSAPTVDDAMRDVKVAEWQVQRAVKGIAVAESFRVALGARISADQEWVVESPTAKERAVQAARAEREHAVLKAEVELLDAEREIAQLPRSGENASEAETKQRAAADTKLAAARKALADGQAALEQGDDQYTHLGTMYPRTSTGRRTALATWLTDRRNPRTARVAVNHLWLRHFGEALVPTVANFGPNGRAPTHPALLDWLAVELMDRQWSMKHLHRQLVLSSIYRLSSAPGTPSHPNVAKDAQNKFYWRMNSRRLESEAVRDSILQVAGELDVAPGGPEIAEAQGMESRRRSMYFRSTPNEKMVFLELFDQANPNECYRRKESIVPQQALALTNSSLSIDKARRLAERLREEAGSSSSADSQPMVGSAADEAFVNLAFETILSRTPSPAEQAACQKFLARSSEQLAAKPGTAFPAGSGSVRPPAAEVRQRARENLIHVLFNHNDFVTLR